MVDIACESFFLNFTFFFNLFLDDVDCGGLCLRRKMRACLCFSQTKDRKKAEEESRGL